jgi:hypothetical protein
MGVNYWVEQMAADENQAYQDRQEYQLEENIRSFMEQTGAMQDEGDVWVKV